MSRKRCSLVLGMLVIAAVVCAEVQAQGRGGRGGPGGGRGFGGPGGGVNAFQLLQVDEVRAEIELSDEQVESIKKAADEQQSGRDERPNFRDLSDEEREAAFAEMREKAEKDAKEAKTKLSEILVPPQIERLEQISLQMRGAMALADEDIVAKVGLSEANVESVKKAIEEAQGSLRDKMREMFTGGGGGDRDAMAEKFKELRKEMNDSVLAVLSEDQRNKFAELQGTPFELPQSAFGRGFGGGRGGPGGRRGGDGGGGGRGQRPDRPADE